MYYLLFIPVILLNALVLSCSSQSRPVDYSHALLIDVRTPQEFEAGSVVGAINIPVDIMESAIGDLPTDKQIVVFCRSGNRSSKAQSILNEHGFANVINGGTWQQVNAVMSNKNSKK
jgi:phage shock protein E